MASYDRPRDLGAALARRAAGPCVVLAGGTDHYPARVGALRDEDILDIGAIPELRGIQAVGDSWRIGATTTWSQVATASLPPAFDGLKLAAREIGGVQIQNRGTIGGNLCNASPAADGVPALLALDASVELATLGDTRHLPLADFILGNRKTRLGADQLLTAIIVPRAGATARGTFLKLGSRRYLVISIAMVAAMIETGAGGTIATVRIAVGACSPVARRLPLLEAALAGRRLERGIGATVRPDHLAALAPIDDVRGTAAYRQEAACELVARALETLAA